MPSFSVLPTPKTPSPPRISLAMVLKNHRLKAMSRLIR